MFRVAFLLSCILPFAGPSATGVAAGGEPPAAVEKLLKAYCARHVLARDNLEPWKSALAPPGRVFRYKLPAFPAKDPNSRLFERYAFVFVDPDAGNVYDLKRFRQDGALDQRAWAILVLMGTKVGDNKQAEAVMADLYRLHGWLEGVGIHDNLIVEEMQTFKSGNRTESYHAHLSGWPYRMTVDADGYVTGFRMGNIR
jgi:hypothetical protein